MTTKVRKISEPSSGERTFIYYWTMFGDETLPFKREYQFHPTREWRLDFAWPVHKVACEIEGGAFSGGRHTRGAGFTQDCEKYNAATLHGWGLLRFTPQMLEADPETCIEQVITLLGGRTMEDGSETYTGQVIDLPVRTVKSAMRINDLCQCVNPTFENHDIKCANCGGFSF